MTERAGRPAGRPPPVADTPMWLSHHWPSDYDRCAVVAGRHVCRRCLVLYPLALVAAVLASAGVTLAGRARRLALLAAAAPGGARVRAASSSGCSGTSPARLVVTTVLLAAACGTLYARYLDDPGDTLVWSVVVVYAAICVAASLWRAFRPRA